MQRFTDSEKEIIDLNYRYMSYQDIGDLLGRTEGSIRNYCSRYETRKKSDDWTDEELKYLIKCYSNPEMNLDKVSEHLKRDKTNVCRKARSLGLTDQSRKKTIIATKNIKESSKGRWTRRQHPRGMSGKHHSKETKLVISEKTRLTMSSPDSYVHSEENRQRCSDVAHKMQTSGLLRQRYSRGSMGKREDLGGLYVRSSWEANYARYLNWLVIQGSIKSWQYEPDEFIFEEIKRGCRSYLPDFKIFNLDGTIEYHEVKGWMDQKSATKLKRMAKYYPDIKIIVIDSDAYKILRRDIKIFIPNWE
jgi:hypothetical protein